MGGERTYAALESRELQGSPTGGRAFGYRDGEAAIVPPIFTDYANGASAKAIAEALNREGVSSPGASWSRTTRRRGGWAPSAIGGDPNRGIGILNNALCIGRDVWNRTRWVKDPNTGRRRCVQRPESEWIVKDAPDKRLVPDALWSRVKARQVRRSREVGDKIRKHLKRSTGRGPRYLFSSLLKCKVCGSNYVLADATHYSCSGYVNGRVCANGQRMRRDAMERKLLTAIRTALLSDHAVDGFKKGVVRAMRAPAPDVGRSPSWRKRSLTRSTCSRRGFAPPLF